MGRKRADPAPEGTAEATDNAKPERKTSKAAAVRAAINEGLRDNQEIGDFVKQRFDLDMDTKTISVYKSKELSKASTVKKGRGRGKAPAPAQAPKATDALEAIAEASRAVGGIHELKRLVDKLAGQ